jgi:hypothetical protein
MLQRIFRHIDTRLVLIDTGFLPARLLTSGILAAGLVVLGLTLWNPLFETRPRSHSRMINITWLGTPPSQAVPSAFRPWPWTEECRPAWEVDEELFSALSHRCFRLSYLR